jgi:predicted RNase H-like HicB family nuclease
MKKRYAIVMERAAHNYAAYVPDLPGCVSTGKTVEDVERNIRQAIAGHLQVMREVGEPIPEPSTAVSYVDAPIPA